jgi:lipid A 4'-phosphatase
MHISANGSTGSISMIRIVVVPLFILVILTAICVITPVDLKISGWFYDNANGGWFLRQNSFLDLIYNKGLLPGIYITGGALLVLLVGFRYESLRRMRKVALYLVLVMVIGPGLIVNAVLKEHWGRPRPRDVENFGGKERFEKVWEYDAVSPGKSFPSGHASMGFFFFSAYFLTRGWGRGWAIWTLATALILGALLGFTRIAQGGHYFSDVIWSAGICYFVALGLFFALRLHKGMSYVTERRKFAPWQLGMVAVFIVGGGLLTVSIPHHEEKQYQSAAKERPLPLEVDVELLGADIQLSVSDQFWFESDVEGFGLPGSRVKDSFEIEEKTNREKIRLAQKLRGFFISMEQPVEIEVPAEAALANIATSKGDIAFDATALKPGHRVKLTTLDGNIRIKLLDTLAVRVDLEKESTLKGEAEVTAKDLKWDEKEQRWKRGGGAKAVIEVTVNGLLVIEAEKK